MIKVRMFEKGIIESEFEVTDKLNPGLKLTRVIAVVRNIKLKENQPWMPAETSQRLGSPVAAAKKAKE